MCLYINKNAFLCIFLLILKKKTSTSFDVNVSPSVSGSHSSLNESAGRGAIHVNIPINHSGIKDKAYQLSGINAPSAGLISSLQNKLSEVIIPIPNFGKKAPDRILLFHWGLNQFSDGAIMLNEETAKCIVSSFVSQANLIKWDIEHASVRKLPLEEQKSYAASSVEVDQVGIWLNTEWTPKGRELVESGGYMYFSPSILGEIRENIMYPVRILSNSLTNDPKLKNLKPLLMSMNAESIITDQKSPSEALLTKIRPLREVRHAVSSLMSSVQSCMGFYGNSALPHPGIKPLSDQIVSVLPEWLESIAEMIEQLDPEGETMEEKKEEMAAYSQSAPVEEKISATEMPDTGDGKVSSLLSLCQKLTGKTDIDEMMGSLLALSHNQGAYKQQVKTVEKSKVALMVEMGIKEGKIPPHERQLFESMSEKTVSAHLSMAVGTYPELAQDVTLSEADQLKMLKSQQSAQYSQYSKEVDSDWEKILKRQ
jgi:phage I-like protein